MASLSPKTTPLDFRLAKHLARRTTYAYSSALVDQLTGMTPAAALSQLFSNQALTMDQPIDPLSGQPWINDGAAEQSDDFALRHYVIVWWLHEAKFDETIQSKLMFFLHQCFTVHAEAGNSREFFDYLAYLRHQTYGSFKFLAKKICLDNTMLGYLDTAYSWADSPNENFGREFLELFSIGKGPQLGIGDYTWYTEHDIQQAARIFTGWVYGDRAVHIDDDTNLPMAMPYTDTWAHDYGVKTFSDKFVDGNNDPISIGGTHQDTNNNDNDEPVNAQYMMDEIDQFVDMVFDQAETGRNFARKMYRFFVSGNITSEIENDIIVPLGTQLINSDYDIMDALTTLLTSQHFYDEDDGGNDEIVGGMMKSPLDNVLHTLNQFNITTPDPYAEPEAHYDHFWRWSVREVMLERADMNVFQPSNVAGYPAYYDEVLKHRAWFNSSTIIPRYKLGEMLLLGHQVISWSDLGIPPFDSVTWIRDHVGSPEDPTSMLTELTNILFPEPSTFERIANYFVPQLLGNIDETAWADAWQNYLATDDPEMVKPAIDSMFKALIFSQEYQLA